MLMEPGQHVGNIASQVANLIARLCLAMDAVGFEPPVGIDRVRGFCTKFSDASREGHGECHYQRDKYEEG